MSKAEVNEVVEALTQVLGQTGDGIDGRNAHIVQDIQLQRKLGRAVLVIVRYGLCMKEGQLNI